jgi:ubiquinone/menaquinone biosynthesis C-methylase UbiE
MASERKYLPAASLDILLPAYDPIMRLFGFTRALRPLVDQAELLPHHIVLDIGCGTGALDLLIADVHPGVAVTGIDPDPRALARAERKAQRAGVVIRFDRGFADALPYPDEAFDRVFSSMMLHHVPRRDKLNVLRDVRRVLKPQGRLELLDFAGGTHSFLAHILHGHTASDAVNARLLERMREAGFADACRTATRRTPFGALGYYQARK